MDPLLLITERVPVDPGEGPFKVRGMYYARLLSRADELPEGRETLFGELRDPRIRPFLEQTFAWSDWYDAFPAMPVHVAVARAEGEPFEKATRERARATVKDVVAKVYRTTFEAAGTDRFLNEMPRVLASQFDFGELEVEAYEPGRITVSIARMPRILAPAVVNVLVGAHEAVLDLIGSPSHRVRYEVARDGQERGYEAVRATLNGVWVVP